MIFTGDSGETFGYADGWIDAKTFRYTGEGQVGPMRWIRGNAAIRDHARNGRRILLFSNDRRSFVRYDGEMRFVDFETFLTPDRNGDQREAIRFILERVGPSETASRGAEGNPPPVYRKPNRTERSGLVTSRVGQGFYRQQLLEKFGGTCAATDCGPSEILIASHIVPWKAASDEERLDVENGILLSPNYDALFDRHLISFADDGCILVSALLDDDVIEGLGINRLATISVSPGMRPYLQRHRERLR